MKQIMLDFFKSFTDVTPVATTLGELVNLIKNDAAICEHTEKHRRLLAGGQKRAADYVKSSSPCFAVAVRFKDGKGKGNICGWTSLGLVDIDHVAPERMAGMLEQIRKDPHTLLCYTTISGRGIRILYHTDALTDDSGKNVKIYAAVFSQANQYYAKLLDCECDTKCKNVTRLSGLAHDPNVFFNPEAEPFRPMTKQKASDKPALSGSRLLKRAVRCAERQLEAEGVVYAAHHHNEYIMRMGYLLNAYGVDLDAAIRWATEQFADYDGDVAGILSSCYRNTEEHGTRALPQGNDGKDKDEHLASVEDIETFLRTQASFRYNCITGRCEATALDAPEDGYIEIDDRFVNSLWSRMCKTVKSARLADIRNVLSSEFVPLFNPFEEYFGKLPEWDGTTDPIDGLASTVTVKGDQAFFRRYFKKWFISVVASLFDESVVNHEILVFIGPQGGYKTTWMNRLLPPELRRYFYVKSNNNQITKDDLFSLTEFALICLEEIDELRPSDLNRLKSMVTQVDVNERAAYAHYKERRYHIASFCGTTNHVQFLTDLTGNRRWLPFEVVHIDDPYTCSIDYAAVYSQAYTLWKKQFKYWLTPEEIAEVNAHNLQFEVPCLERELILTYYRRPLPGEEAVFVTTAHILNRVNCLVKHVLSPMKISLAMKEAGFEPERTANRRGYRVIELNAEEVSRNEKAMARFLANDD